MVVEVPPLRLAELQHHRQARRRDLVGALLVHLLQVVPDARAEVHLVGWHLEEDVRTWRDHAAGERQVLGAHRGRREVALHRERERGLDARRLKLAGEIA